DDEGPLGAAARFFVASGGQIHFGMVEEAETSQVSIVDRLGQKMALTEIAIGLLPVLLIRTDHSEIVISDCAAAVVPSALVRLEGALIVWGGVGQIALDVGQDAEVLPHPCPDGIAGPAELERAMKCLLRILEVAGLEVKTRNGIQRFGRQDGVS